MSWQDCKDTAHVFCELLGPHWWKHFCSMIPGPGPCHRQPSRVSVHMYKQVWPLPPAMRGGQQCWQSSREKGFVLQVDADKWFWLALQITGWRNSFQLKCSTLLLLVLWTCWDDPELLNTLRSPSHIRSRCLQKWRTLGFSYVSQWFFLKVFLFLEQF